jgi:hypothetical protein
MSASSHALTQEVSDLVLEQILAFKQPSALDDPQLLEYHLRYLRILTLYRELDRVGWERAREAKHKPLQREMLSILRMIRSARCTADATTLQNRISSGSTKLHVGSHAATT